MKTTDNATTPCNSDPNNQVVVLMTDMVQYSLRTAEMCPEELRDFIINYHNTLMQIITSSNSDPVDIEPSAGDGSLVVFRKRENEDNKALCSRAVNTVLKLAYAIENNQLPPTRMGLFLGSIIEAELWGRMAKFSTCFAVANRLEELSGYFGTAFLMDREVARNQTVEKPYLVSIGKFSLSSVKHPMNAYTIYKPGINGCPKNMNEEKLLQFIQLKNDAMDLFSGNLQLGILPDFPSVRTLLIHAQAMFDKFAGKEDPAIARILEYIRETPYPASDFNTRGMMLMEKKRDSLGDRLFHLSKQLLKAMDREIYYALVEETDWELYFKLEWFKAGSTIIEIGDTPDGIYYLDSGTAKTYDDANNVLSTMEEGEVFGEMAYFGDEKKRTATVVAQSNVVVRKISTEDFRKLPIIIEIFQRIAANRKNSITTREAS